MLSSKRSAFLALTLMSAVASLLAQTAPPVAEHLAELVKLSNAQLAAKDFDAALKTYEELSSAVPDAADKGKVLARISEVYQLKGELASSLQAMEKAAALLPDNPQILTNLGLLYESQGDKMRGRQCYQKALAIDGNNPLALNNLALLLADTDGDLDLALAYARAAKEKVPQFMEVTDTIGWIYLKKGMFAEAADQFRQVTESAPKNAEFHYHYAIALNKQGNGAEASRECQAALENDPSAPLKLQIKSECAGRLPR